MTNNKDNKRQLDDLGKRRFLQGLSAIMGGAAVSQLIDGSALSHAMAYQPQKNSHRKGGLIFTQAQMVILRDICAITIPKTDTLGAAEVDCHGFVDNQLHHCHDKIGHGKARALLDKIDELSRKNHKSHFFKLSSKQKLNLLTDLEAAEQGFDWDDQFSFKKLKHLIVFGYYTSEEGASKELIYDAYPGGFKGSIPYKEGDKAWGSLRWY